jgi:hypothetical protein
MKILALGILTAGLGWAEANGSAFKWSMTAYIGANALDAASSWNRQEANPLLRGRGADGRFDGQSLAIKAGIVGAVVGVEWLILRRRPDWKGWMGKMNFVAAGATGGVAVRNWRVGR